MSEIQAMAAKSQGAKLERFKYNPGELRADHVEIRVEYCGLCHSDLSMLKNDWGISTYPLVPGHEAIGTVEAVGSAVTSIKVGQTVGLGWNAGSCLHCRPCLTGDQNMCQNLEQTIVSRHGAFAEKVRCHWVWATPIPQPLDVSKVGPLLCGGITVFNPFLQHGVLPTDRVGVIGIGGLGHMALMFANKWGCDVTAFSSSAGKAEEAMKMGAHHVIDSRSAEELKKAAGSFDFILSTVNVTLDWPAYVDTLSSRGHLHVVGVPPQPLTLPAFPLIAHQRSVGGSPSGAPGSVAKMLDFAARHGIAPIVEEFPMSKANEALEHLEKGKARYRIVLRKDL